MIIVIEGPDNAGKTTLAHDLAKRLKAFYLKTERLPTRSEDLMGFNRIVYEAAQYASQVVVDRHPAISEPIYGSIIRGTCLFSKGMIDVALEGVDVIVYCRPPDSAMLETLHARDQMEGVVDHSTQLIEAYDEWASNCPVSLSLIKYDYTRDSVDELIRKLW